MTIENTLERIAVALEKLANRETAVAAVTPNVVTVPVVAPTPTPAPVTQNVVTVPVVAPTPVVTISSVVVPTDCPIKDAKSLMDVMMGTYKELGPVKGARIQEVLVAAGCKAVNEVTPDKYVAIWTGIQALKAA